MGERFSPAFVFPRVNAIDWEGGSLPDPTGIDKICGQRRGLLQSGEKCPQTDVKQTNEWNHLD